MEITQGYSAAAMENPNRKPENQVLIQFTEEVANYPGERPAGDLRIIADRYIQCPFDEVVGESPQVVDEGGES